MPIIRLIAVAIALLGVQGIVVASASAEIDAPTTTHWGVDGLAIGTQTDSIASEVFAIEQIGNRIYVGGRFTNVAHENNTYPRSFIAAFDAGTGIWIDTFLPVLDGPVYALAASPDGSRLFVGGEFTQVNGENRDGLIALDPTTGAIDSTWSGITTGAPVVRALDVANGWLYVGGSFNGVASGGGNNQAFRAARFDLATTHHDPTWRPQIQGGSVWGIAASADADRVYIAGYFTSVNQSAVVGGFAAIEAGSGLLAVNVEPLQINTTNVARQYSYDVEVSQGLVWVAGSEHSIQVLNEVDLSLEIFHRSAPRGDYQDLEVVGDRVYAGCHCRASAIIESANGVLWFGTPPAGESDAPVVHSAATTWVAAFDATNGQHISSFRPPLAGSGAGVWAIHGSDAGACVWFGGSLNNVASVPVHSLTRLCDDAVVDDERPSVPGRPMVTDQGPDSVDLSWIAASDNVAVAGYRLFDAATHTVVATETSTEATLNGLAAGSHGFYVKAFDDAGNTSWRSGVTVVMINGLADTQRPTVPTGLRSGVHRGDINLSWNAATDNVAVSGYQIFDATSGEVVATSTTTSATMQGLDVGVHSFYVKAIDAAGNTSWRSNISSAEID